jgi:hypothetical protein
MYDSGVLIFLEIADNYYDYDEKRQAGYILIRLLSN